MERNRDQERGRYPGNGRNYASYYEDPEPGYYGDHIRGSRWDNRFNSGNRSGNGYENSPERNYPNENRGPERGYNQYNSRSNWNEHSSRNEGGRYGNNSGEYNSRSPYEHENEYGRQGSYNAYGRTGNDHNGGRDYDRGNEFGRRYDSRPNREYGQGNQGYTSRWANDHENDARNYGSHQDRAYRNMEREWHSGRQEGYSEPRGYGNRAYGEPDRYYGNEARNTYDSRNRNGRNDHNWQDQGYDF